MRVLRIVAVASLKFFYTKALSDKLADFWSNLTIEIDMFKITKKCFTIIIQIQNANFNCF